MSDLVRAARAKEALLLFSGTTPAMLGQLPAHESMPPPATHLHKMDDSQGRQRRSALSTLSALQIMSLSGCRMSLQLMAMLMAVSCLSPVITHTCVARTTAAISMISALMLSTPGAETTNYMFVAMLL